MMKDNIHEKIINFRNNEISNLLGSLEYPDKKEHVQKIYNYKKNKKLVGMGLTKDLFLKKRRVLKSCKNNKISFVDNKENLIGNPKIYNFFNFSETGTNINNNLYYSAIKKVINEFEFHNIIEIGSGFGKLCSLLKTDFSKNSYNIIELPGSSLVCLYYLENYFKKNYNINFCLNSDKRITYNSKTINIIPFNNLLESSLRFPEKTIVINTQSFQHMNMKTILLYNKLFKQNNVKAIISLNRDIPIKSSEVNYQKLFIENNYQLTNKILIDGINNNFYLKTFQINNQKKI